MTATIGIDPGWSGGIAIMDAERGLSLHKMPGDYSGICALLTPYAGLVCINSFEPLAHCWLELVHANSQNGCKGNWQLSANFTSVQIALNALAIPFTVVSPQRWMKRLQPLPSGAGAYAERKRRVKELMKERYPEQRVTLATADALAILDYGLEQA